MFNKFINSIKNKVQPVKAISYSGLMPGMESMSVIKEAQTKTVESLEDKENKFLEVCNEGIKMFQKFAEDHQKKQLKKAMEKFLEAREIKTGRVEPYFYLSCIAYILDDKELAIDSKEYALKDIVAELKNINKPLLDIRGEKVGKELDSQGKAELALAKFGETAKMKPFTDVKSPADYQKLLLDITSQVNITLRK